MKIPLQEKIAELERRIAGLELRATAAEHVLRGEHRTMKTEVWLREWDTRKARGHWREMWRHFDLAMKSFFKVEP